MQASNHRDLALRLGGEDHALEPGRVYRLGRGVQCDFRCCDAGVAEVQAELCQRDGILSLRQVDADAVTLLNGVPATAAALQIGDCLRLGELEARVVRDLGMARIVPDPVMVAQKQAAVAPPPASTRSPVSWLHRSAAALPMRRQHEATFTDLLADELRRAPWFGLSLLVHAILLLLALWLTQQPDHGGRISIRVGYQGNDAPAEVEAASKAPDLPVTIEEPAPPLPIADQTPLPPLEDVGSAADLPSPVPTPESLLRQNQRIGRVSGRIAGDAGDVLLRGGQGLDSGGFRETVAELRASGLEIVFVFDSTGSMGGMIDNTKQSIEGMLEVLRALVPDARFGLVTYRDRDRGEDYLVRALPLAQDFWRARNFMHFIDAGGGGDRPEAVCEGLRAAFDQDWHRGARRVVILAGDAPAHADTEPDLQAAVRLFCRDGRSSVHAVITGSDPPKRDVQQSFEQIARWGGGICVSFGEQRRLMQLVLSLAFGRQFERNIDQVYALVAADRERTSSHALDLARSGGAELEQALAQQPVAQDLVHALVQRPRRPVARQLAQLLGDDKAPESARQAAAYVLQRTLGLEQPPVDPERGGPLARPFVQQLVRLADRLR